jgi:hypothetical protein
LCLALAASCGDHLSGPQVVQLVDSLEHSLSPEGQQRREQFFSSLKYGGWTDKLSRIRGVPIVSIRRDGRALPYRGVVFEHVMVPGGGLDDRSGCAGTRRVALFWAEGDRPDPLTFSGGDFQRPWVQGIHYCSDVSFIRPAPSLDAWSDPSDPNPNLWWATAGNGEISPGTVTGPCVFLTPEDERYLRDTRGISCAMTRHLVRFSAHLARPVVTRSPATRGTDTGEIQDIELQPAELVGFRYTIQCDRLEERDRPFCARRFATASRPIGTFRSVKDLEGVYYARGPVYIGPDQFESVYVGPNSAPGLLRASLGGRVEPFNCREQVVSLDTLHLKCEGYFPSKATIAVDGVFLLRRQGDGTAITSSAAANDRDIDVLEAVVTIAEDGRLVYSRRHRFAFRPSATTP